MAVIRKIRLSDLAVVGFLDVYFLDDLEEVMQGRDLVAWRKRNAYSQEELMRELGVRSRQTVSSWENSEQIPRLVQLAVIALEINPSCRTRAGQRISASEKRRFLSGIEK